MNRLQHFAQMRASDYDGYRACIASMFSAAEAARKHNHQTEAYIIALVLGRDWSGKP